MWHERLLHLRGARLEDFDQISMATVKVFKHFVQLLCGGFGVETKNPVDDMIGPEFIGRVEVSGLSRRLERPDDDSGRIRAQIQTLAIQKSGLRQRCSLGALEAHTC
jgi:hypothetical protein